MLVHSRNTLAIGMAIKKGTASAKAKKPLVLTKSTKAEADKKADGVKIKKSTKMAAIREKTKAIKAKNAALKGKKKVQKKKVYRTVTFRRPHTLRLRRSPRYLKHSIVKTGKNDYYDVIQHPVTSECAMKKIEDNNTLTFAVAARANKHIVKSAVKSLHHVEVSKVNILNNHDGKRIAFVRLTSDCDAVEAANKIGII